MLKQPIETKPINPDEEEEDQEEFEEMKFEVEEPKPKLKMSVVDINNEIKIGELFLKSNCESMNSLQKRAESILKSEAFREHLNLKNQGISNSKVIPSYIG